LLSRQTIRQSVIGLAQLEVFIVITVIRFQAVKTKIRYNII
jgi:hypothetical protein